MINNKILYYLKKKNLIDNTGSDANPNWIIKQSTAEIKQSTAEIKQSTAEIKQSTAENTQTKK